MSKAQHGPTLNRRALVLAAVSGLLGFGALELYEARLVKEIGGGSAVSIVVATSDLARGAALTKDVLGVRSVPEAYAEPREIREDRLDGVLGATLGIALKSGETLQWTDLDGARGRGRQLSDLVEPGTRAYAVQASTFSGLIRPGDRVDVLERKGDAVTPSLQGLVVLAVGESIDPTGAAASSDDAVTLGGSPEEIAQLTRVAAAGSVALALRNSSDTVRLAPGAPTEPGPRAFALPNPGIEHVE